MYTSPRGLGQYGKGLEAPLGRTSLVLSLERDTATRNQICAEPLWFRLPILVCSKGAVGLEKELRSQSVVLGGVLNVPGFGNLVDRSLMHSTCLTEHRPLAS